MKLAVKAAQGAAMALAKTIRAVRGSFSFPVTASTTSITMPGTMYPMGESAPILPTIPSASARPLCTAPIIVAQPKRGTKTAATTRNIREKDVPMPPGMCSASVSTLVKGPITFLANRPRSQHSARKIRVLRRVDFIRHSPFGKNKSVSFLEKKNTHAGTTPLSKTFAHFLLKHGKLPRFQDNSVGDSSHGRRIIESSVDSAARKRLKDSIVLPCSSKVILA